MTASPEQRIAPVRRVTVHPHARTVTARKPREATLGFGVRKPMALPQVLTRAPAAFAITQIHALSVTGAQRLSATAAPGQHCMVMPRAALVRAIASRATAALTAPCVMRAARDSSNGKSAKCLQCLG